MTGLWVTILISGLVSMTLVTAHEITEHGPGPLLGERPGDDEQWAALLRERRADRRADRRHG